MPDDVNLAAFRRDATTMIDAARYYYWKSVRAFLHSAEQSAEHFEPAIGEVSADEAFDGWLRKLREALTEDGKHAVSHPEEAQG
jgi:DNA-binding SARP family transcriptional activator